MNSVPLQTDYLKPGEIFWGSAGHCIGTLLGSCVSVTLWHPDFKLGIICHYLLPDRPPQAVADARYAADALPLMVRRIERSGTRLQEYQGKIFGGGNMFPAQTAVRRGTQMDIIGERNIQAGMQFLKEHGIRLMASDVGGNSYRTLLFDISDGAVWLRRQNVPAAGLIKEIK